MNCILYGYGRAGRIHYQNLIKNPRFNLKYVVDKIDLQNVIPDNHIKGIQLSDTTQIYNIDNDSTINCVFITSPTSTHYHLVIKYLSLGKHVFVEKTYS